MFKHGKLWFACMCVCLSACGYAAHMEHYADVLQPSALTDPGLYSPDQSYMLLCISCYLSLSSAYKVIQHVSLSFALALFFFPKSQHASMSATLPTGFWFMNPILVCHYCLQKGALMDQYVESVTMRIASCPQTSWIFLWQPVACSTSALDATLEDNILTCYKNFWVISFCR